MPQVFRKSHLCLFANAEPLVRRHRYNAPWTSSLLTPALVVVCYSVEKSSTWISIFWQGHAVEIIQKGLSGRQISGTGAQEGCCESLLGCVGFRFNIFLVLRSGPICFWHICMVEYGELENESTVLVFPHTCTTVGSRMLPFLTCLRPALPDWDTLFPYLRLVTYLSLPCLCISEVWPSLGRKSASICHRLNKCGLQTQRTLSSFCQDDSNHCRFHIGLN